MNVTKEEFGARFGTFAYALVTLIGLLCGGSLGESSFRGILCAIGALLLGQFLGGILVKAVDEGRG